VRSSNGSDLVRVTATPPNGFDVGYGYSPDGSRILFARFVNNHGTLLSVKPDGGGAVQLSPPNLGVIDLGFFDRAGADWSPDSTKLLFSRENSRGQTTLWTANTMARGCRR
jgi:Tol biopolymer transport system component